MYMMPEHEKMSAPGVLKTKISWRFLTSLLTAVGFLIAAKSILRLDTAKQGRSASEYVIIGTMASFAWALGTTYAAITLLEIAAPAP